MVPKRGLVIWFGAQVLLLLTGGAVAPAAQGADVNRGVYAAKLIQRDGAGWNHELVLYTRQVRPPDEGAVLASNGFEFGRLASAEFQRPDVWKMRPDTRKRRRVVRSLSREIAEGARPELHVFGGRAAEPIPADVIEMKGFNERFYRD